MNTADDAVDRIRILECPTGDLENRIAGIFEDYGVANKDKVRVVRDSSLDREGAQAYLVKLADARQSFVILADSGYDDYVAKVVDIYTQS
ncbi:MAG TPA: hypothetical protein VHT34_03300 [Clostridia bacterium]|nr:hypothetical protein [Clostridia bacterium]